MVDLTINELATLLQALEAVQVNAKDARFLVDLMDKLEAEGTRLGAEMDPETKVPPPTSEELEEMNKKEMPSLKKKSKK